MPSKRILNSPFSILPTSPRLRGAGNFLNENWMLLFALLVLTVMTWAPKIPLFEIIPGYIVRARLEDVLIGSALFVFVIQLIRHKATLRSPITPLLIFYAIVGVLSMLNAMYLVKTLPLNTLHVGKMFLHFARRLEYFSIFYVFYAAVKRTRDIRIVYAGIALIMLGVIVYGYGQKYLLWPVFSTMNREYSKGVALTLSEHDRLSSTFGGHYDLAAFMLVFLTLILSAFFFVKTLWKRLFLLFLFANGFWVLILASSRSSFLAYLLSIGTLILFVGIYKKSIWWTVSRGLVVLGASLFVMASFGDLSSRFSQLGFIQEINTKFSGLLRPMVKTDGARPTTAPQEL